VRDSAGLAIGIDVGGTFTDVVCSDGSHNWRAKAPTDPKDFGNGVVAACERVAGEIGCSLETLLGRVARFGLGTTAVTNVLATRKGRRVGLLTTSGFEYQLPAARGRRVFNQGWLEMPWVPVDPDCIVGIDERVDRDGKVLRGLEDDEVLAAAHRLVEGHGVDAFAVSFLWSFRNPSNETRAVSLLRRQFPEIPTHSGVELHPTIREYERTTMAVLNAFAADSLDGIERLRDRLRERGLGVPLLLLQASGGTTTIEEARRAPIRLAQSGPAAGAVAAAEVGASVGVANALCCDMGGTSFDVAFITKGAPERRQRGELHGVFTAQTTVDVESVGSGGGSIAWIDNRGLLRVGPQSARALPGPVCYGRGGTEPTVTDALVVLGFIDPEAFLGGALRLDVEAARSACARVGSALGLNELETAWGIREIALAEMVKAVRARLASGGLDPRKLAIVSFGGCGQLFTPLIAEFVGIPRVLVPRAASVLSAFGAASADVQNERARAVDEIMPVDEGRLASQMAELGAQADADVAGAGIAEAQRSVRFEADLRFYRQTWELSIPIGEGPLDQKGILEDFRRTYARRYGEATLVTDSQVEFVALRAIGTGRTVRASLASDPGSVRVGTRPERASRRSVRIDRERAQVVDVYAAEALEAGHEFTGPAIVDAADTTIWVPAGARARSDERGTLHLELKGRGAGEEG
jgi:N-methylhydantoinase A